MSNEYEFGLEQVQTDLPVNTLPDAADPSHLLQNGEVGVARYDAELNDGTKVLIIGDVTAFSDYNHHQGDNDQNCQGDCGLVSSMDVLNQFGIEVNENDVVHHAIEHSECDVNSQNPEARGQSTTDTIARLLTDYGITAHTEAGGDMNALAQHVQNGQSVIIATDAGQLWHDTQYLNEGHAVTVTGAAYDPQTGQLMGFFINDSGTGESAKFVSLDTMQHAWVDTGGQCVVTDAAHPDPAPHSGGHDYGGMIFAGVALLGVGANHLNLSTLSRKKSN